jgi:hypothetical protein
MTRSKLFLAATSGLLAITGVAAAKAHNAFGNRVSGFYSLNNGGACNIGSSITGYLQTTGNQAAAGVRTQPGGLGQTYTVFSKSHSISGCIGNPLRTRVNQK